MQRRRVRRSRVAELTARMPRPAGVGRSTARLVTIGLIILSLWLLASFVGQVITSARMDRAITDEHARVTALQDENQRLTTAVAQAQSDAYVEQVARDQFGLAREGDTVLLPVLPEATAAPPEAATPAPEAAAESPSEPNWHGWLRAFFPAD